MADEATTQDEFLTREVMLEEVNRWRDMNVVAEQMYEALPPMQQEAIRLNGQPSIVALGTLVGCEPGRRRLAWSILDQIAELLSHPVATVEPFGVEPSDETTGNVMNEAVAEVRELPTMDRPSTLPLEELTERLYAAEDRLQDQEEKVEALQQLTLAQDRVIGQLLNIISGAGTVLKGVTYARLLDSPPTLAEDASTSP